MSNIIDSIQLSGSSYDVRDKSATTVVEITQSDYDNLPSSAKTSNILYIITDGSVDYITSGQCQTQIDNSISGKQDTLIAGENITISGNVISAEGGGGGKAIEAGRGISITTGETADTINCTLPISAGTGTYSVMFGQPNLTSDASGAKTITGGQWSKAFSEGAVSIGQMNEARGQWAWAIGNIARANGKAAFACGNYTSANYQYAFSEGTNTTANTQASHAAGSYTSTKNRSEFSIGEYNNSVSASTTFGDSGNTLFSVGNGTSSSARHNAFEIRQNGDIYLTKDGQDVKLQDQLGGGGSSYSAGTGIDITNDVISVTGMTDSSAFTAHTANTTVHTTAAEKTSWNGAATNASNAVTALGGLSLVKLTQAQYDALTTKDSNTLYVIVN